MKKDYPEFLGCDIIQINFERGENFMRKITKKIVAIGLAAFLMLPASAHAAAISFQEPEYSEAYKQWIRLSEEERSKYIEPIKYAFSFEGETNQYPVQKLSAKAALPRYSLKEDMKIDVKDQANTNSCWAQVAVTQMETNTSALTKKDSPLFSARHMEYATSRFFANGEVNTKGFNRNVGGGGNYLIATAYLTSGQGAVLENKFPFVDSEELIAFSELNKAKTERQLKDFEFLTDISKYYDDNGDAVYFETPVELRQKRNKIKEYIVNYGAVSATTWVGDGSYYSTTELWNNDNVAYYCNGAPTNYLLGDHAVSIIGWDDNYSKTNFREGNQPKNDGAYIVQNSWGTEFGDNGIFYVSYDDFLIESQLMSITNTSDVSYDQMYQYDEYGYNYATGQEGWDVYSANVFKRDVEKKEKLTEVGVYLPEDSTVDVYVNAKGEDKNIGHATYHQSTGMLSAGYHNITLNTPQTLEADTFTVVTRVDSYAGFEVYADNGQMADIYAYVDANANESFVSDDGIVWDDMITLQEIGMRGNACIKAFTTIDFTAETATELKVYENKIFVLPNITVQNTATVENFDAAVRNDVVVTDANGRTKGQTEKVTTGDKITIKDKANKTLFTYTVALKGDVNADKQVKLYDAFKILEVAILGDDITGEQKCIMDYNNDENISLYDAFKFLEIAILG